MCLPLEKLNGKQEVFGICTKVAHNSTEAYHCVYITVWRCWCSTVVQYFVSEICPFVLLFCSPGEIFELKAELNSDKKDRKKEAVKKVIASMTVGKDVR